MPYEQVIDLRAAKALGITPLADWNFRIGSGSDSRRTAMTRRSVR